ncbi:MAG TPA: tryptophan--tRNA ligase, partial [bacterium]|nr:tryptophan--tRNA ligase [bacterium]
QLPHLEITRELARRFNTLYGKEVFPVPEPLLTEFPRLPGLDGKRMSKSLGNAILISDPPDVIAKKISTAITDPEKIHMGDAGHPDICNIYAYQRRFNEKAVAEIRSTCVAGTRGCVACKKEAAKVISEFLAPIRERRSRYEADRDGVMAMLKAGAEQARETARATMIDVRQAMGFER